MEAAAEAGAAHRVADGGTLTLTPTRRTGLLTAAGSLNTKACSSAVEAHLVRVRVGVRVRVRVRVEAHLHAVRSVARCEGGKGGRLTAGGRNR